MFLQQLINGLAPGYSMAYGIFGLISFANGEIYMPGAYLCTISPAFFTTAGLVLLIVLRR